jgi:hypothetical protein
MGELPKVEVVMSDCVHSAGNDFKSVFGKHVIAIWCMFHVLKTWKKHLKVSSSASKLEKNEAGREVSLMSNVQSDTKTAQSQETTVTMPAEKTLQNWKVVELRAELTKLGFESKGLKAVLVKRLADARKAARAEVEEEKVEEPTLQNVTAPVETVAEAEPEPEVKAEAEAKEAK